MIPEIAKEFVIKTDILSYLPDLLKDVNLIIVENGLKILVNLSNVEEVIDCICKDEVINCLQEMTITSNKGLRKGSRALLDIVRTRELSLLKI